MLTRVERAADRSRCRLARFGVESNSTNHARSSEITGDQPMIPDAPSDSFYQKIAHMTSPERRRWPQTAKVDGNGARARIPCGHPPARQAREAAKSGSYADITLRAGGQRALMSHVGSSSRNANGPGRVSSAVARSHGAAGAVTRRHLGALLRPAIGANSLRLRTKINAVSILTAVFGSG